VNEPIRQRDHIDKSVSDVTTFTHTILVENPGWTGHYMVHVKEGVVLDIEATRRYKINR